jgi:hypothetical protein
MSPQAGTTWRWPSILLRCFCCSLHCCEARERWFAWQVAGLDRQTPPRREFLAGMVSLWQSPERVIGDRAFWAAGPGAVWERTVSATSAELRGIHRTS